MLLCSSGCPSTLFFRNLGSWQGEDKKKVPPQPWDCLRLGRLLLVLLVGFHSTFILLVSSTSIISCDGQDWCDEKPRLPQAVLSCGP